MRILVTGGAGFIGSNFISRLLGDPVTGVARLVNLDAITYAGNLENLAHVSCDARYSFVRGDIAVQADVEAAFDTFGTCGAPDVVVHFAAESHVDRSIEDPAPFLRTNVLGTHVLLEISRRRGVSKFVQISTDEVYGSLDSGEAFTEETPMAPNSPYSASKASSDLLARAYYKTYSLPVCIVRCSNNYGPRQFPEKFIPLMIMNAMEDRFLPIYGTGLNVRDWIHVDDHCDGVMTVLQSGRVGETYNLGGATERTNLEVALAILSALGKPRTLIRFVADRPGHDFRYAMDFTKATNELGWRPKRTFEAGILATVEWYRDNPGWVSSARSGNYLKYYNRMYGEQYANALTEP